MKQHFYKCGHCGNIIAFVKNSGVPIVCCGEKMTEIVPDTTDAAVEKHLPVWTVEKDLVRSTILSGSPSRPSTAISAKNCIPVKSRSPILHFAMGMRWRQYTPTAIFTVFGNLDDTHGVDVRRI